MRNRTPRARAAGLFVGQQVRAFSRSTVDLARTEPLEARRMMSITASTASGYTVFTGVGTTNATAALAAFQKAIGGVDNGNTAVEQSSGSRRINWDGVLLDGTDFGGLTKTIIPNKVVGIPVNRFQTRGALFGEVYAVSGDGFASANPGVAGQLTPFSQKNEFGHFNDIDIDTSFIKPSAATTSPVQQAVRGFGAIFLDVDTANASSIEYSNGSDSLGQFFVPPGASGQPEFLGVVYNSAVVTNVEVAPGTSPLFFFNNGKVAAGEADLSNGGSEDMSAVDDFVYGEPAAVVHPIISHATEGASFTGTVGSFTTTTSGATASQFTAKINWGDGTATSTGTVSQSGSTFSVKGTHTYAEEGTFNVSVAISDKSGNTATAKTIAEVADAALHGTAVTFNASTAAPFRGTVATFKDDDSAETDPNSYTTQIDWGDGTTTVGTLSLVSAGKWAVRGVHQYAKTGKFTVKITILDVGGSSALVSSTANII